MADTDRPAPRTHPDLTPRNSRKGARIPDSVRLVK